MNDNNDLIQIHIDGIHARQSRMFSTVTVPRSAVTPVVTPECIELVFKHHFPREVNQPVEPSASAATAAKSLGFRVLRLTIAGESTRLQILPEP
jgi:hypothetical protein